MGRPRHDPQEHLQVRLTRPDRWNQWSIGRKIASCRLHRDIRELHPAGRRGKMSRGSGTEVASISRVWGRSMSFRPFTSESYSEGDRPGGVARRSERGRPAAVGGIGRSYRACHGVAPQCRRRRAGAGWRRDRKRYRRCPIRPATCRSCCCRPKTASRCGRPPAIRSFRSGTCCCCRARATGACRSSATCAPSCLSVTPDAFGGRKVSKPVFDRGSGAGARPASPRCFRARWNRLREISRRCRTAEWAAVAQSLADLLPTFVRQLMPATDAGGTATRAAILHRLCQTIERRLDDPDLTPARVAEAEGISERYLQKLFEGSGSSFTHYVRERRLQRASAELSNPAEAHHSISEIAYRNGFNDSAHFSRAFRHRFGLSPREFRQQELERASASAVDRPARLAAAGAGAVAQPSSAGGRRTKRRARAGRQGDPLHRRRAAPSSPRGGSRARALGIFLAARCRRRSRSIRARPSRSRP